MVMSRDSGFKFQKFSFFAQFCINFQEKLQNLGEIGSKTKKLQAKNQLGVETPPPPPPSAYRVKEVDHTLPGVTKCGASYTITQDFK